MGAKELLCCFCYQTSLLGGLEFRQSREDIGKKKLGSPTFVVLNNCFVVPRPLLFRVAFFFLQLKPKKNASQEIVCLQFSFFFKTTLREKAEINSEIAEPWRKTSQIISSSHILIFIPLPRNTQVFFLAPQRKFHVLTLLRSSERASKEKEGYQNEI